MLKVKKMKRANKVILGARVLSAVFNPFYLPTVGLVILFTLSYLSLLPLSYKLLVLGLVYIFTILIPTLLITLYRHHQRWTLIELGQRERRMVPYVISIISYFICVHIMESMHIPHFMASILIAALMIQILCSIVNVWWKISTHTAAIGGMAGAIASFSMVFGFNPVFWLCVVFMVAGILGTCRMILRQHSLAQVVAGFVLGSLVGLMILFI